jgi:signal transduction histidine kinase
VELAFMKSSLDILQSIELFQGLTTEDLQKILKIGQEESFSAGEVIFREGDLAEKFYVILQGKVEVWKNYGLPSQDILAIRGAGDTFGEMALIDELPRSATLKTVEPTLCLVQKKEDFQKLLKENSTITLTLMKSVSAMVRQSNEAFISGLRQKNLKLEKAYQDLQVAQQELIKSERLSTLGKFASMVLHDLRNPISILKGYAEMIVLTPGVDEKISKYSEKIVAEAGRLSRMAGELLDFSRGDIRLNLLPVQLDTFFLTLQENIAPAYEAKELLIKIDNHVQEAIMMDLDRLLRVFINLADNARKAMEKGGTLTISARPEGKTVVFFIEDTGKGMSPEVLEKIFDPFFSQSTQGGTGLGMLVVSNVISAHQGVLRVESQEGLGTKVIIQMPKTQEMV